LFNVSSKFPTISNELNFIGITLDYFIIFVLFTEMTSAQTSL